MMKYRKYLRIFWFILFVYTAIRAIYLPVSFFFFDGYMSAIDVWFFAIMTCLSSLYFALEELEKIAIAWGYGK